MKGNRCVYFGPGHGWLDTPIYRRAQLPPGRSITGPAIVEEMSATVVMQPGQTLTVDPIGNLVIAISA